MPNLRAGESWVTLGGCLDDLAAAYVQIECYSEALATARESIRLSLVSTHGMPKDLITLTVVALVLTIDGEVERAAIIAGFIERASADLHDAIRKSNVPYRKRLHAILETSLNSRRLTQCRARGAAMSMLLEVARFALDDTRPLPDGSRV